MSDPVAVGTVLPVAVAPGPVVDALLDRGQLEMAAITYLRGRSITDEFVNEESIKGFGTKAAYAIDPYAIDREFPTFGSQPPYEEYWATFGLNQDQPSLPIPQGSGATLSYRPDPSFTPWPSALRITMTINDPEGRLEQGQVYQFVVEIPEQARGDYSGGS